MKRIILILLSICLLTGCNITKIEMPETAASVSVVPVTIRLVCFDQTASFLEQAAQKYSELHSEVTFSFTFLPNDSNYYGALIETFHNENPPDAFMINGASDLTFLQDQAQPIEPPEWIDGVEDALTSQVRVGEQIYALPIDLHGYGIIYNADLFASLSIDPAAMSTLTGFTQTLSKLNERLSETGFSNAICSSADLAQLAVTQSTISADSSTISLPSGLATILQIVGGKETDDPAATLAKRQSAIYLGSSEIINSVVQIDPSTAKSLQIAPLPFDDSGNASITVGCDYLAVNRYTDQTTKDALSKFLTWLYTSSTGRDLLQSQGIQTPYDKNQEIPIFKTIQDTCAKHQIKAGTLGQAPSGFASESFYPQTESFQKGEIDYATCKNNIQTWWEKNRRNFS